MRCNLETVMYIIVKVTFDCNITNQTFVFVCWILFSSLSLGEKMEVSSSTKQTVFSRTRNLREWPSQNWVQFYLRGMLQVIKTNDQNNFVANSLVMSLISKLPKESLRFLKYNTHVTIVARLSQLMSCVQHTLAWAYSATSLWMEWQSMSVLSCT